MLAIMIAAAARSIVNRALRPGNGRDSRRDRDSLSITPLRAQYAMTDRARQRNESQQVPLDIAFKLAGFPAHILGFR